MIMRNPRFVSAVLIAVIIGHAFGCASLGPVTSTRIREDMAAVKKDIAAGKNVVRYLIKKRIGKTGFYYIIDTDGIVIFHPQSALIGSSFKDHWFINKLCADRNGCLAYRLGHRTHLVFFEEIGNSEILCFSIVADDMSQPPLDCQQIEMK